MLAHDDAAGGDLFGGQFYFGMEKFRPVRVPSRRRAALQVLQRFALGRTRGAN
jgi:hypothetical protein